MSYGEWIFSPELCDEVDEFCTTIRNDYVLSDWVNLRDYEFEKRAKKPQNEQKSNVMAVQCNAEEKDEIINMILAILEGNKDLDEDKLLGIDQESFKVILTTIEIRMDEQGFSHFCKLVCNFKDNLVLNACFDYVILKKVKDSRKNGEVSTPMISLLTELAVSLPNKVCNNVLIPLLTNDEEGFSYDELLNGIFPVLQDSQKDSLIMAFTKKSSFKEQDWNLLHPLVNKLTLYSLNLIIDLMHHLCEEFSSSKTFSNLLVAVCKNLQFGVNKDLIYHIIDKNRTLLKRQALRSLES